MTQDTNVLIVGSGIAGSLVANMLVTSGIQNILMLEAGPDIPMGNYRAWADSITSKSSQLPYTAMYDVPADYQTSGVDQWKICGSRVIGRGGSTVHWGGWVPRFMPEDFALKTNTGTGTDWPFSYADLEPYYCKAETYLGVAGVWDQTQRDWRSEGYPMAGAPMPLSAAPIIDALNQNNFIFNQMPVARNTISYNGQPQCITTGTCNYCPIGARFTGDQPLNQLAGNPNFTLQLNSPVTQLIMTNKNTVGGVQYVDTTTGETHTINAQVVYLCSGAFEIPKLLQLSKSSFWPAGVGNDNDLVGRYLIANPYISCDGTMPTNPQFLQQELNFPNLISRQWDTVAEQQNGGKFLMNMSYDLPILNPADLMYQGSTAQEINQMITGPALYEVQGAISPTPYFDNRVTAAAGLTRFGLPRSNFSTPNPIVPDAVVLRHQTNMQNLFTSAGFQQVSVGEYPQRGDHAAATCRMTLSDVDGVVDDTLKVFGVDNLFIASNAAVPTLGAANVTLTLLATIMRSIDKVLASRPSWSK